MGLKARFNLVMLAAFLAGVGLAAGFSFQVVYQHARSDVLDDALIMMTQARAIRGYLPQEIDKLLAEEVRLRFTAHGIPSWAAQRNLNALSGQFTDYTYKEAALNPANPADKATDWEADIIAEFRRDAKLSRLVTTRKTAVGPAMVIAQPIRITDQRCLTCHSTASAAPGSPAKTYSQASGIGWQMDEVIGAQIVSMQSSAAFDEAAITFWLYLAGLSAVLGVTILLLNLLLHYTVVKPIRRLSEIASEISMGRTDVPEFPVKGRNEIATLGQSFNRMRRSLSDAMEMLRR